MFDFVGEVEQEIASCYVEDHQIQIDGRADPFAECLQPENFPPLRLDCVPVLLASNCELASQFAGELNRLSPLGRVISADIEDHRQIGQSN